MFHLTGYTTSMKKYMGGCHCGAVRYEVETDLKKVIECNCSHCHKKGLILNFVAPEQFKLISGEDNLTEYNFNKKAIRHLFCKTCGVQSFARGVTFPKVSINVRCLDGIDPSSLTITPYNGKDI